MRNTRFDHRLGSLYAVLTALLFSTQEPFSAEAAHQLASPLFVGLTQVSLLLAIPLMLSVSKARRDFVAIFSNPRNYPKLAGILALGLGGLLVYNYGLSGANPIVIAAILNLSPFWAAVVAILVSGKKIPISPAVFFPCFAGAFAGAMLIAISQQGDVADFTWGSVLSGAAGATWLLALPVPALSALNATMIGEWFGEYDESASLAANFLVAVAAVLPVAIYFVVVSPGGHSRAEAPAIALLILGTLASVAAGRVFYQIALSVTGNDNGFVSMFFLLVPASASLMTFLMSWFIPDLRLVINREFFLGLALVTASLLFFSLRSWRDQGK